MAHFCESCQWMNEEKDTGFRWCAYPISNVPVTYDENCQHFLLNHEPKQAVQNTKDNRVDLAYSVVESWDMDTLIGYAIERLIEDYENDDELFQKDWREAN